MDVRVDSPGGTGVRVGVAEPEAGPFAATGAREGLTFELLGPVRVLADGQPLEVGGPGPVSLLACLLLHANKVVPVSELVEAIWADADEEPPSARRMVRMYAGRIRRALDLPQDGTPALVAEAPGFRLAVEPEQVDAHRFERLLERARVARATDLEEALRLYDEALELWRGPALAGLPLAERGARRLEELRMAALESRVETRIELGETCEAIGDLEELIAAHPLRERLHVLLMTAHYRAGRQSDALAHFKAFRRRLVEELGVEPGGEVRELERAILRQDPALDTPVRGRSAPVAPLPASAAVGPRRGRLLLALGLVLVVAAAAAALLLRPQGGPRLVPGSVGVIDARDGHVLSAVAVGKEPSAVMPLGLARALVATRGDRSVALVDLVHGRLIGRFGTGIAGGKLIPYQALLHRTAVLADPEALQLEILDLDTGRKSGLTGALVPLPIQLPFMSDGISDIVRVPGGGAYATSSGWLIAVGSETHYEWEMVGRYRVAAESGPLAFARRMVWMAPHDGRDLFGFDIDVKRVTRSIELPGEASALAASGDDVWVALKNSRTLLHYSGSTSYLVGSTKLPAMVSVLRATPSGAWIGTEDGRVLHVLRKSASVLPVALLHHRVAALAVQHGRLVVALG